MWTCVQWPPNLVKASTLIKEPKGRIIHTIGPIGGQMTPQPKVGRPKRKSVHITNPFHVEETHSGGIQHVDSMKVHINGWDGVHVASPIDPWSHQPKKENYTMTKLCTQDSMNHRSLHWLKMSIRHAKVASSDPSILANVWVGTPPNHIGHLPTDSRRSLCRSMARW